jgi:transposase-like protein
MKGQRRKFSDDFKLKVVHEANEGKISLAQLALKFDLTPNQIKVWKKSIESVTK